MPELAWSGNELIANRGPQVQAPDIFTQSCGPGRACRQLCSFPVTCDLWLLCLAFGREEDLKRNEDNVPVRHLSKMKLFGAFYLVLFVWLRRLHSSE